MLIICEGIFFVVGLIIVVTGKARIGSHRVTGTRARVTGILLFLPGPIMLLIGMYAGATSGNIEQLRRTLENLQVLEILIVILFLGCAIGSIVFAPEEPEYSPTNTPASLPEILTVDEVAHYLRISDIEVRVLIETGRLQAKAISGEYRISSEAVTAYLKT